MFQRFRRALVFSIWRRFSSRKKGLYYPIRFLFQIYFWFIIIIIVVAIGISSVVETTCQRLLAAAPLRRVGAVCLGFSTYPAASRSLRKRWQVSWNPICSSARRGHGPYLGDGPSPKIYSIYWTFQMRRAENPLDHGILYASFDGL